MRPSAGVYVLTDDDVLRQFASAQMQGLLGRLSAAANRLRAEGLSAEMVAQIRADFSA